LTSEDLARLGEALREGETVGLPYAVDETKPTAKHAAKADHRRVKLDLYAATALRLLILTGARLREILHAKWEQIDLERGLIFLADSKTGKKTLYLSAAAQRVLADLPRVEGNPYVIAGAKDGAPRADLKKPWTAVSRAAGLEGVRIHDLRNSFASFGAGASLGLPIIGKLLGPFPSGNDPPVRAPRRRSDAPCGRDNWGDDFRRNGWEKRCGNRAFEADGWETLIVFRNPTARGQARLVPPADPNLTSEKT
jgi:Phage integrase family